MCDKQWSQREAAPFCNFPIDFVVWDFCIFCVISIWAVAPPTPKPTPGGSTVPVGVGGLRPLARPAASRQCTVQELLDRAVAGLPPWVEEEVQRKRLALVDSHGIVLSLGARVAGTRAYV